MDAFFEVSGLILSAGWMISGVLFAIQSFKIYKKRDARGVSAIAFFGFAILNLNALFYGYMSGQMLWIPGTLLASVSCVLIAIEAMRFHVKDK